MMSEYRQQQGLTYWTCQSVMSLLHDFIMLLMSGSCHRQVTASLTVFGIFGNLVILAIDL
jgi:hypothetical protein